MRELGNGWLDVCGAPFARTPATIGGVATIDFALGSVVLLVGSALCFDLYSRIKAECALARVVVTMADYVSRDPAPDGNEMTALGRFLYQHDLGVPANLVYVVTAVHQPAGDSSPAVLWTDDAIRIGDEAVTEELAANCPRHVTGAGRRAFRTTSHRC